MEEKQRVNIDVSKSLWQQVGIRAAVEGTAKRDLVEKAITKYLMEAGISCVNGNS